MGSGDAVYPDEVFSSKPFQPPDKFDPRTLGCRCDVCPLGEFKRKTFTWAPVPPEPRQREGRCGRITAVGEFPGADEVMLRRPQIGPSGQILMGALRAQRVQREEVTLTNLVLCFPGDTLVSATGIRKVYRRWYEGPVVRVTTVRGNVLTGTPNHPAYTPTGEVPLGKLAKGDDLLCTPNGQGMRRPDPHVHDGPATIEQVYRASAEAGHHARAVGSRMDFHGDGAPGDVDVVLAHGELGLEVYRTQVRKHPLELRLECSGQLLAPVSCDGAPPLCPLDDLGTPEQPLAVGPLASLRGEPCANLGGGLCHPQGLCSTLVPEGDGRSFQGASDDTLVDTETPCDPFEGLAAEVCRRCRCSVDHVSPSLPAQGERLGLRPESPGLQEEGPEPATPDVQVPSEVHDRLPCSIATDQVLDVEWTHFTGHVYNLETDIGWYIANNVLVSNCQPPGNDLDRFRIEVRRDWKRRIRVWKRGGSIGPEPEEPEDPITCCSGQLTSILHDSEVVIPLGAAPAKKILQRNKGIQSLRGGFYTAAMQGENIEVIIPGHNDWLLGQPGAHRLKIVPSISPAFPLGAPMWMRVFYRDIERAVRWATGQLKWTDARVLSIHPTVAEIAAFLSRQVAMASDIETTRHGPLESVLRCIGVYDIAADEGICIPWESIDGTKGLYPGQPFTGYRTEESPGYYHEGHYTPEDGREIIRLLRAWMLGTDHPMLPPRHLRVRPVILGHNFILFDMSILELALGLLDDVAYMTHPDPVYIVDGVFLARCEDSELPRSLYLRGTLEADVPDWKGGGEDDAEIRVAPRTYAQLAQYNGIDNKVSGVVCTNLYARVQQRAQAHIYEFDRKQARVAREMNQLGIKVDQDRRAEMEEAYTKRVEEARAQIRELVGREDFNPNSTDQLRELLYEDWGLPPVRLTDTGEASTDDDSLRELMPMTDGNQRALLGQIRHYRLQHKTLTTILLPLRSYKDIRKNNSGQEEGGLCGRDGRVHPQYPIFVPATGRFASKNPNSQNIIKDLRYIFVPEDGHVFLMADYDQIELRLFSACAKVKGYLDVFNSDPPGDPHAITAILIYGDRFERQLMEAMNPTQLDQYKRTKVPVKVAGSNEFDLLRTFAKTFVYCVIYGGTDDTVFLSVSSATNPETGELLFPDMTRREVTVAYKLFMKNAKEIPAYWDTLERFAKANQFIPEPVYNRRRDFLEFDRNAILNHPIQGGAGAIAGTGLLQLRQAFPPNMRAGIGIVNQMHDAFTVEVPEVGCQQAAKRMEDCINLRFDQIPGMYFSAECDITTNWRGKKKDFWVPPEKRLVAP